MTTPPAQYATYSSKRNSLVGGPSSPSKGRPSPVQQQQHHQPSSHEQRSPTFVRPNGQYNNGSASSSMNAPQPRSFGLQQDKTMSSSPNSSSSSTAAAHVPAFEAGSSTSTRPTSPVLPFQPSISGSSSPFRAASPISASQSPRTSRDDSAKRPSTTTRAPYNPAFQPQGVRRDRTDELVARRNVVRDANKLEQGRLARRLEKLVELHFPRSSASKGGSNEQPAAMTPFSSFAQFSNTFKGKSARDIWNAVASRDSVEKDEQAIVKWQDDQEVSNCPICGAAFGLRTRRHHCRLCGRVVCFLPPTGKPAQDEQQTGPVRLQRCSTFFTYEYFEANDDNQAPIGVVVEVEPVENDLVMAPPPFTLNQNDVASEKNGGTMPSEQLKDTRRKVRVCRDCLRTVLAQQLKRLPVRTPTWLKLYEVLVQLEGEIEDALPEFQELVLGIQKPNLALSARTPSVAAAKSLRKRLLSNLASYENVSKRIGSLPLDPGAVPGGSQDKLQRAISQRAALFIAEKLGLLRTLGNVDETAAERKPNGNAEVDPQVTVKSLAELLKEGGAAPDQGQLDVKASGKLAVLLEQESLVQSYVDDANAKRQFEDAASLKASLIELRQEIARIRASGA